MRNTGADYHLYRDLASWWPLISPADEYAEEAAFGASLLRSASIPVHDVLELGSGGGHNAWHLKQHFTMTLVDLSGGMLAVSRRLNPDCEHVEGDMRDIRLGRLYDAVFVHDAVDYMTTEPELRRSIDTAATHCRAGGVVVFVPDHTTTTFEPTTEHGGSDADDGRGARYLAWTFDPDPADTEVQTEYVFLLRDPDSSVHVVHETHYTGLFSPEAWLGFLADAGLDPYEVTEQTGDERAARKLFVGHRPTLPQS